QAEDGIRDFHVTGVQTCALPILVENTNDVMAIENTSQYRGLYHVLGGVISPMNGIGPGELKIESLLNRLNHGQSEVKELILALRSEERRVGKEWRCRWEP